MFELPTFTPSQRRVIYLALAGAIAVGALFFSLSRGSAVASTTGSLSSSGKSTPLTPIYPTTSPTPELPMTIVVDVAGKVAHPGIYTLPQGSRAATAIAAAGNALKGVSLTDINLAEVLTDGQQLIVGQPIITQITSSGRAGKSSGGGKSGGKITSGTININTATVAQFEQLPGVGAVMAARILAYRTAHGNFAAITDLSKVSGMGKSKYANLKNFVRV